MTPRGAWFRMLVLAKLDALLAKGDETMATLADLKAQVAANTTVIGSAIAFIQGLAAQLQAALATGDPAAVQAVIDQMKADDAAMAAAIATPPVPTPPPTPAP